VSAYLLDVNVLLALTDPQHLLHEAAHRWWQDWGNAAWATCPITENGFVRVASHPSYPNRSGEATVALAILRQLCSLPGHHFWADNISLREAMEPDAALTHGQVTDAYLLGLAVHHGGRMATFDQRVVASAVRGGVDVLEVIAS